MLYFFLYYFNSALFLHFVVLTRIVVETRIINIISSRVVSNANFLKTSSTEVNQRLNIGIKNPGRPATRKSINYDFIRVTGKKSNDALTPCIHVSMYLAS